MRVGLFSDSHRDTEALDVLLDKMGYIDAACFMGDVSLDAAHLELRLAAMPNKPPLYAVRGNNDRSSILPDDLLVDFGGKIAYMTHGHLCASLLSLAYRAKEKGADIVLFGHTHAPLCEEVSGVLMINPGSAGNYCRGGAACAKVLVIDGDRMRVENVTWE